MNSQSSQSGVGLVEVMVAMFLLAVGVLAAAPMLIYAVNTNAAGAEIGSISALTVERLEILRATDYDTLVEGGSTTTSEAGYFDNTNPGVRLRWQVIDNVDPANTKTIIVRAVSDRQVGGEQKELTLTTLRSR